MGFSEFALKRLIRLYPMILCGVFLGGFVSLFGGHGGPALILAITAASLVFMPIGLMIHQEAYPINNPIWSLFFELAANAVYAIERRTMRVSEALPAILLLLASGVVLVAVAYGHRGVELVGFSSPLSFIAGFARVTFPFFAGVFIYRYGIFKLRFKVPSLVVAIALILVLTVPMFRGLSVYDAIAVILIVPTIVILGANASRLGPLDKIWTLLGQLSYPFYIIHQPILRAMHHLQMMPHFPRAIFAALPVLAILAAAASAYVIMTLYDEPVRKWLNVRLSGGVSARR